MAALIETSEALVYLALTDEDEARDAWIEEAVLAASAAICAETGRTWAEAEEDCTRYLSAQRRTVFLKECLSVDSVTDADGEDVGFTQHLTEDGSRVLYIELDRAVSGQLAVVGTFGWDAIPEDVKHACRITVQVWYQRDLAAVTAGIELDTGYRSFPSGLPSAARALLKPHHERTFL